MAQLNYKHLRYFFEVANRGSLLAAAEVLHLTPQTLSSQIKTLEDQMGVKLFDKSGRQLTLSSAGERALDYARQIFSLGDEFQQALQFVDNVQHHSLRIGIVDVIPKAVAHSLISPVLEFDPHLQLICKEQDQESLLAQLAIDQLDLVLSDRPLPLGMNIEALSQSLGSSMLGCFATPELIAEWPGIFPENLQGAPVLLPTRVAGTRHDLLSWLREQQVTPRLAGEFDDSALMKTFARHGLGFFFAPELMQAELQNLGLQKVASLPSVKQAYYAIRTDFDQPKAAIKKLCEGAQQALDY